MPAVIFDLGRVLVGIDETRGIFRRLAEFAGEDAGAILDRVRATGLFRRYNRGEITSAAFHAALVAETGVPLAYDEFVALWQDIFYPIEAMEALFWETRAHVPVGLLSDTDPIHWDHLRARYPFLATIPRPTLSFEIGEVKPHPSVYRHAAENVGAVPEDCLFLDDLLSNVEGARAVGMKAEVFRGPAEARAFLVAGGALPHATISS